VVLSDGSNYTINGCTFIRSNIHYGRAGYINTVLMLWRHRGPHRYYFMLPDDFLPVDGMVDKAITLWQGIPTKDKICLNLFADRIGVKCWTGFSPVDMGAIWHTQWVDMCFMAEDLFFTTIMSHYAECPPRYIGMGQSSGVGAYISRTLKKARFNLYQVKESLVIPQEEHKISQMYKYDNSPPRKRKTQGRHITDHRRIFGKPSR